MAGENTKTTYTLAEWHARARELFGDDSSGWKFVCPSCAHVASVADWKAAGAPDGCVAFSCVGRWTLEPKKAERKAFKGEGGPCNYAGGGLFALNPITVIDPDGRRHEVFAFAEAA